MTTPMPPDPFGRGGLARVVCACGVDLHEFILTERTVRAVCPIDGSVNGEWRRHPAGSQLPHGTITEPPAP